MANVSLLSASYRNLDDNWFLPLNSGNTITIDGTSTLIINSDVLSTTSSWGGPQNVILGSLTINDGTVLIDGRFTRMLSFSGSSAAIMTGSKVTGSTSQAVGEVIAVYAPPGVTDSGWIKLRNLTSGSGDTSFTASFESGSIIQSGETLTFSASRGPETAIATAAGIDRVGFLTICGREGATVTTTRLANFIVRGSWYEFENSGSGTQNQYFLPPEKRYLFNQPTSSFLGTIPAMWVETESGSGNFVPWINGGFMSGSGVSGSRGNMFFHWPHTAGGGTVAMASSSFITASIPPSLWGKGANGNIIPPHARIRIPNIHFISAVAADAKGTSSFHTTAGTRYDFTTTNAGVIDCDKALATGWYFSLSQPYSALFTNVGMFSSTTTEVGTNLTFDNCGVGIYNLVDEQPLTFTGNYGSTIVANSVFGRARTSAGTVLTATSCKNINITNSVFMASGSSVSNLTSFVNCANVTMSNSKTVGAQNSFTTYCDTFYIVSHSHYDSISGSIPSTRAGFIFTNCNNFLVDSLITESACGTGSAQRGNLFTVTSCNNIRFRNIGSPSAPYPLNFQVDYPFNLANYNTLTEMSRCYFTQSRTGFLLSNNSNAGLFIQNCWLDPQDPYLPIALDCKSRGIRMSTGSFQGTLGIAYRTQMAAVYGTHFFDTFMNDYTGSVGFWAIEATADPTSVASYTIIKEPVNFDSVGGVRLQSSGSEIIWQWPWFVKGHAGFLDKSPLILGTGSLSMSIEYQLDKGNGYPGTWISASSQNLAEESASINPSVGFKMKVRTACTSSNLNNILYGMIFYTSSSLALQRSSGSLYPLDTVSTALTFTNVQSGSEIRVYTANTQTEMAAAEDASGSFSYNYIWEGTDLNVDVQIVSLAYEILRYEGLALGRGGLTIPLQQRIDRNYYNP